MTREATRVRIARAVHATGRNGRRISRSAGLGRSHGGWRTRMARPSRDIPRTCADRRPSAELRLTQWSLAPVHANRHRVSRSRLPSGSLTAGPCAGPVAMDFDALSAVQTNNWASVAGRATRTPHVGGRPNGAPQPATFRTRAPPAGATPGGAEIAPVRRSEPRPASGGCRGRPRRGYSMDGAS